MAKDQAAQEAADDGADVKPKKKSKAKLFLIIGLSALLLIGGGAGFLVLRMKQVQAAKLAGGEVPAAPKHEEKKQDSGPPVFVPMDNFTVNLNDGANASYLQLGVVLEVSDVHAGEALKVYMPIIRSHILLLLSSKTKTQLSATEGKKQLSQEILTLARSKLPEGHDSDKEKGLREVHFATFVIQ